MFSRRDIVHAAAFAGVFVACGLVHVALWDVPFTRCITQLLYGGLALVWGVSLYRRVADRRLMHLLVAVALMLALYTVLQLCRYALFSYDLQARRLLWYAYYLPMLGVPTALFFAALYTGRPSFGCPTSPTRTSFGSLASPARRWILLLALLVVLGALAAGVLTNDLHGLAFRLDDASEGPVSYGPLYGPLYYLFWVADIALLAASVAIMVRKARLAGLRTGCWQPLVPVALGIAWMVAYLMGAAPRIDGVAIWNIGEVFGFMTAGFVESCIACGLIPANTEYAVLLDKASTPAAIIDGSGETVLSTRTYAAIDERRDGFDAHYDIRYAPITGGGVRWAVDMKDVRELNRRIESATEAMEARAEALRGRNALMEERAATELRSQAYDRITRAVESQLTRVRELSQPGIAEGFEQNLPLIAFMVAYIKRRGNIELLCGESSDVPAAEVAMAVRESVRYLRLLGVDVEVTAACRGDIPGGAAVAVYEYFEQVIEAALPGLGAASVFVLAGGGSASLRILLDVELADSLEVWLRDWANGFDTSTSMQVDGGGTVASIELRWGGGAS